MVHTEFTARVGKRPPMGGALLILIAVLLSYSNSFSGPFQLDEGLFIANNPLVTSEKTPTYLHYREDVERTNVTRIIPILTFVANYEAHGLAVEGYHLVNLLIHLATALLVYVMVAQLFDTPAMEGANARAANRAALFSALLFAVHPIQTEAVTYIAGRFISLAGMLYVLSVVLYAQSRLASIEGPGQGRGSRGLWYVGSIVSTICAMKTKENAFTIPFVICLYEFLFFRGQVKSRIARLLPMLMTLAVIPLTSFLVLGWSLEKATWAGKHLSMGVSRLEYLFTELTVLVTYLRLLVAPVSQNLLYDYPAQRSLTLPVAASFLFLLFLLVIGIYLVHRSRSGDRRLRIVAFGIFWFFITLSVESGLIPIYNFYICEYRLYTPSVGFFMAAITVVFLVTERVSRNMTAAAVVLGVAAVILTAATHARNDLWKDNVSLWADVVEKSPRLFMPRNKLGLAYMASGRYDSAVEVFKGLRSLGATDPDRYRRLKEDGNDIDRQIAAAQLLGGRPEEAFVEFKKSLGADIDAATSHVLFADFCYQRGSRELAIRELRAALTIEPRHASARERLEEISR